MNKSINLLILLVLSMSLIACKNEGNQKESQLNDENSIVLTDKFGEVRVPKSPARVVVFDLGVLDIMDELGLEKNVIGMPKQVVPSYLEKFKDNKDITNTGSLVEPNFQKVNEANPDLIIISGRQEKDRDEFKRIAPTLFIDLDYQNYLASVSKNIEKIGKIFEMENEAQAINEDMLQTVKNNAPKNKDLKGLFVMYNNGKFSAYGKNSRFGFLHDSFGIPPISEDIEASNHGLSISSEYIQEMNPDILFILDRNAAIGEGGIHKNSIENGLIKETSAFKNDRIVYLSPQVWYLSGGGITSIKMMSQEVGKVQ